MSKKNNKKGFTLVELVVVCLLLSILSLILYKTLKSIIDARDRTEHLRTTDQIAHYVFSRMTTEFANGATIPLNSKPNPNNPVANSAFFEGQNKKNGENDADIIRFVSSNSAQQFNNAFSNHGPVEIQYSLEKNPDQKQEIFAETQPLVLVRKETPAEVNDADIIKSKTIIFPLAENITALNFRYYKKEKWLDEWKTSSSGTPEAIEVTIKVMGSENREEIYKTAFPFIDKK